MTIRGGRVAGGWEREAGREERNQRRAESGRADDDECATTRGDLSLPEVCAFRLPMRRSFLREIVLDETQAMIATEA